MKTRDYITLERTDNGFILNEERANILGNGKTSWKYTTEDMKHILMRLDSLMHDQGCDKLIRSFTR